MNVFRGGAFSVPHLRGMPSKRSSLVTVLDIGSTKVVCLIGRLEPREGNAPAARPHP